MNEHEKQHSGMGIQGGGGIDPASLGTGMALTAGQGIIDQLFLERNIRANQRQARYNQQLALEMWEKTNYEAQRRQMEKAGLNVGLMYKGAGEGGRTTGAGIAEGIQMPAPQLGMAMQIGLQAQQTKAQIELTQAETEKTKAETPKVKTEEESIKQQIENAKVQHAILKAEQGIKELEETFQSITFTERTNMLNKQSRTLHGIMQQELAEGRLAEEQYDTTVKRYNQELIESETRVQAMKSGMAKNTKEIAKLSAEIANMDIQQMMGWTKLSQTEREIKVKEMLGQFATSDPQKIKQWVDVANGTFETLNRAQDLLLKPAKLVVDALGGGK